MTTRSLAALALLALAGCGGADSAPPAKSAAPPRQEVAEPRTVEEAQDQIARLAAELEPRNEPEKPATSPTGGTTQPAPKAEADRSSSYDACSSPCRALASMRRAVDALCRMTGESDNRCVDAKKTLADSVGRTASCKCG